MKSMDSIKHESATQVNLNYIKGLPLLTKALKQYLSISYRYSNGIDSKFSTTVIRDCFEALELRFHFIFQS